MSLSKPLDQAHSASTRALGLVATLTILIAAPFWNAHWGLVDDISWLITVSEKVLAGQRLYVDVIETNPPFSVWLYLLPTAVAHALGITPELAVQIWTYALVTLGLSVAARIVFTAIPEASRLIWRCLPILMALLVIFPGNVFGQREHIGVALYLPMIALTMCRFERRMPLPLVPTAVVAGLLGSVLLMVKPYYALIPLVGSLCVAWRHRSLRPIFATENWVIAVCCLIYLAAVQVLAPEFVRDILPLLVEFYLGTTNRVDIALYNLPMIGLIGLLVMMLHRIAGRPAAIAIPMSAAAAAAVVLFLQGKGWAYHIYPMMLFSLATIAGLLMRPGFDWAKNWLLVLAAVAVICAVWQPFKWNHKPDPAFITSISAQVGPAPTISVLSAYITTGHPFTRAIGGRWASQHPVDWIGVNSLRLEAEAEAAGDEENARHDRAVATAYRAFKLDELRANPPDLLLIADDEIWEPFWKADSQFGDFLRSYVVVAVDRTLTVMARRAPSGNPANEASPEGAGRP